jgi:hypothetical protein
MLHPLAVRVDRFQAGRATWPSVAYRVFHRGPRMPLYLQTQASQLRAVFRSRGARRQDLREEMFHPQRGAHHVRLASAARAFAIVGCPVDAPFVAAERFLDAHKQKFVHEEKISTGSGRSSLLLHSCVRRSSSLLLVPAKDGSLVPPQFSTVVEQAHRDVGLTAHHRRPHLLGGARLHPTTRHHLHVAKVIIPPPRARSPLRSAWIPSPPQAGRSPCSFCRIGTAFVRLGNCPARSLASS